MRRNKKNIAVTGAQGFIGQALVNVLLQSGDTVLPIVRTKRKSNDIAIGNIGLDTDWSSVLVDVDCIVHVAARAHIMNDTSAEPLAEFRRVNVEGTLKLAQQAVQAGVRRLVFLSSIGVNGNVTMHPFKETDTPRPADFYAISKYEAEQALLDLASCSSLEVVIIRPPLVYGPNAPGNFGKLLRLVKKGIPLPLGAINNKRSFVALNNLVDLIVTCINHPAAANQTFLAGDGEDLSTTELLSRLGEVLGIPARLVPVPVGLLNFAASLLAKKDIAQKLCGSLQVDISKARELLGWEPPLSVEKGLREVIEDVKK